MKRTLKISYIVFKVLAPFLFLFTDFYRPNSNYANQNIENKLEKYTNIPDNNFYILGPGDQLSIKVEDNAPSLNKPFKIDGEGIVNLPRLKRLYVSGLTVEELTKILNKKYAFYVKNPDVNLTILKYRPVEVFISGEVENPGYYILRGESEDEISNSLNTNSRQFRDNISLMLPSRLDDLINKNSSPTLFLAIRKSGGVTLKADLKNVIVTRKNKITNGSGRIQTSLDLIEAISSKDLKQNIRLHDGDSIYIPKSENPVLFEITKATQTNLNPKYISVLLTGRFNSPGRISVNSGASLLETIDIAGGTKVIKGNLIFIRYNSDGTFEKRKFRLKKSAPIGSYKNPYMKNGDIIYVEKGAWVASSEVLGDLTAPVESVISTIGLYKFFTDD